jgi:hypothetical protein
MNLIKIGTGELCQKKLLTIKKIKTMNRNELIIQETNEWLENYLNDKIDFEISNIDKTKNELDYIHFFLHAGFKLGENLIYYIDIDTLNTLNWFDVFINSLKFDSSKVYNFILEKIGLNDSPLFEYFFKEGLDVIENTLYCTSDIVYSFRSEDDLTERENELKFLEEIYEYSFENDITLDPWDLFISNVIYNAEEELDEKISACFNEYDEE